MNESYHLWMSHVIYLSQTYSQTYIFHGDRSAVALKDRSEPRRIKETPGALVTIPPKKKQKRERLG